MNTAAYNLQRTTHNDLVSAASLNPVGVRFFRSKGALTLSGARPIHGVVVFTESQISAMYSHLVVDIKEFRFNAELFF